MRQKTVHRFITMILAALMLLAGCQSVPEDVYTTSPTETVSISPVTEATETEPVELRYQVEWAKDAVIYEVNVRQYTKEGTFAAFSEHLQTLKDMGINTLWFMPIHPISET